MDYRELDSPAVSQIVVADVGSWRRVVGMDAEKGVNSVNSETTRRISGKRWKS